MIISFIKAYEYKSPLYNSYKESIHGVITLLMRIPYKCVYMKRINIRVVIFVYIFIGECVRARKYMSVYVRAR